MNGAFPYVDLQFYFASRTEVSFRMLLVVELRPWRGF